MRVTPTGQARPEGFAFDPGMTAKTPEQIVASGGRSGGSVSRSGTTQADLDAERRRQEEASIFGALPWWGWGLIAAGGIGLLAFVGAMVLGEDEERPRRYLEDEDDWRWDEDDYRRW